MLIAVLTMALALPDAVQLGATVGGGYGTTAGGFSCGVSGVDCNSASAQGAAVGASVFGLYGDFLAGGLRFDTIVVPGSDRSVNLIGQAVVRVGRELFGELGAGVGHARDRERRWDTGATKNTVDTDFAMTAEVGCYLTEHVAMMIRGGIIGGIPGFSHVLGGLELRL